MTDATTGRKSWLVDVIAIVTLIFVILYPTSGFKNTVVWLGLLWVVVCGIRNRRMIHAGGLAAALLVYFTACLVAAWHSIDTAFSFRQLNKLIEFLAGYIAVVNLLAGTPRVGRTLNWLVAAMGLVSLLDVLRLSTSAVTGKLELLDGRWFDSLLGYPTIAAGTYALAWLLALVGLFRSDTRSLRFLNIAILILLLVPLYFLQTRSALLGLAVGVFTFVLLAPLPFRWRMSAITAAAMLPLLFIAIPGNFRDRIVQGGSSDRVALWKDAEIIINNGVEREPYRKWVGFGYGHKMFEKFHGKIPRHRREAERAYDHTHNLFIELRVQSGYMGVIAFSMLMLTATARAIWRFPNKNDRDKRFVAAGASGGVMAFLVYGQFSLFFAFLPALIFWTLLAIWMASLREATPPDSATR
ncbi:MAG TPA: O-antigen ligase family protein [Kiritimatiellia bacterium]|nr:O-antigen ligase family protein [Kiritimatiellia bacterium]